jgi:hypothetical protein
MQAILAVTVPFFALVLCGYLAGRQKVLPESAIAGLNTFVLYFALPCMLFRFGANTPVLELLHPGMFGVWLLCALLLVFFTVAVTLSRRVHLKDAAFHTGLRAYAAYRDLHTEKATGGAVQAHVIRLLGKCDPKVVNIPHYHGVQFQFLYMLKGWMIGEYEGAGRVKMTAGSSWIQPPGIRHQVIDYSDGCEMLEIILPANFETVEL